MHIPIRSIYFEHMGEVDLQKEIALISKEKTGEGQVVETVLATYSHTDGKEKQWLFRGWNTTSMFELALGENWHYRVYAEPYKPLWADALKELKSFKGEAVLIDLDILYQWVGDQRIALHLENTTLREFDADKEFLGEPLGD